MREREGGRAWRGASVGGSPVLAEGGEHRPLLMRNDVVPKHLTAQGHSEGLIQHYHRLAAKSLVFVGQRVQ